MKVFRKVYCDRVYVLCDERFEIGSGFHPPPPPQRHPPTQLRGECRRPPPPGCVSFIYYVLFLVLYIIDAAIHVAIKLKSPGKLYAIIS